MVRQAIRTLMMALAAITLAHTGCIHQGDLQPDAPKPLVPPPKPSTPPSHVIGCWKKNVEIGTDTVTQKPLAGISGRVYLLDESGTYSMPGDGELTVELYDDSGRAQGEASKKLEIWNIDPDTLKKLMQKDFMGPGYTLSLPWSTYRQDITQVHMAVSFKPKSGSPVAWTGSPMTIDHTQAPQITHSTGTSPSTLTRVSGTN